MGGEGLLHLGQVDGFIIDEFPGADDDVQGDACKGRLIYGQEIRGGVGYDFIFHRDTSLKIFIT